MDNQQQSLQNTTSVENGQTPSSDAITTPENSQPDTQPIICSVCQNTFPQEEISQHFRIIHKLDSAEVLERLDTQNTQKQENRQPKQEKYPNLNAGNNNKENKWALKWKTPEERKAACERYCDYLRRGRSKKFYPEADEPTIKSYIENYPEEFITEKIQEAERKGLSVIEDRIQAASVGKIPGANATLLIFLAKNKLGWRDRQDITSNEEVIKSMNMSFVEDTGNGNKTA